MSQDRPIARGPLTLSVMLATTMYTLDGTIANVALPHMQGSLSAGLDQITWVLTSFIVAQALMTPLVGWVSERIGRKALMVASIIGFTLASLACGLAPNLAAMITFRIIQGICGAAFVPLSQSILFDINPPERHPQAMATFGAGVVLGPALGPALGGWITEQFGWHWVFLINLPVGIVALLGVLRYLPEQRSDSPRPFDFMGFGALALFITALQLMLDRGPGEGWFESWEVIIEAAMAVIGIYIFIVHTITAKKPFFSRALLKNWNFTAGMVLSLAMISWARARLPAAQLRYRSCTTSDTSVTQPSSPSSSNSTLKDSSRHSIKYTSSVSSCTSLPSRHCSSRLARRSLTTTEYLSREREPPQHSLTAVRSTSQRSSTVFTAAERAANPAGVRSGSTWGGNLGGGMFFQSYTPSTQASLGS